MTDEVDRMMVSVRADTSGFRRDVAAMRGELDAGLGSGAERAGRSIEASLLRATRSGKLGFDDLKTSATRALAEIAAGAVRTGLGSLVGGGAGGGGGIGGSLIGLFTTLLTGRAGRATGGPVAPGQAYMVGERGPELFVPTASGRVETGLTPGGGAREVRVAITVNAQGGDAPGALRQSSRQVARAVRAALMAE